jgi:hypothetical protein
VNLSYQDSVTAASADPAGVEPAQALKFGTQHACPQFGDPLRVTVDCRAQ